ncbi:threonine ammonia-lyase [Pseudoroseomonas rhizosphaerae]|uniref:Threonine ammonia-lyase n=1 Tax=Teichococcus rhizosphaerae TaxID=1335062 RepID=A0A2C7AEZ2_9PROT|nr:threonine ammonia-lyase [Pseudoroseomonas rhizosphaerae]PHK95696.1 threonine ammonia-lyase [Pseudoroseomonas rhizosphaerae]
MPSRGLSGLAGELSSPALITLANVREAAARIQGAVLRTPTVPAPVIGRAAGCEVWLKLDNLQATGAFKERGAANRLALLTAREKATGVIAMSAGNHAQAVARHASRLGIRATIVMPRFTPATKVVRTESWGATVVLHGETLAEAAAHAHALALREGLTFIHPYDDRGVIAGQGTMAIEMIEDAPGLDTLVFPVGGGGLLAGCAAAALEMNPSLTVYGVEVEGYPAMAQRLAGQPIAVGGPTVAEGIAVRDVGEAPYALIKRLGIEVLVVPERAVEQGIALLAEGAKVVAEGAGAAGVAALLAHPARLAGRRVGTPVCGGNIDARALSNVLLRQLLRDGRIMRLHFDIPDRPGVLADISRRISEAGGNVIEVKHQQLFGAPTVQSTELELMIEVRDAVQGNAIVAALEAANYTVRRA